MTDDFIDDCKDRIARLTALLPHAEAIDATFAEVVPQAMPDRRRIGAADAMVIWEAMRPLPKRLTLVNDLEDAISNLEDAIQDRIRQHREDAEERARIKREDDEARLVEIEEEAQRLHAKLARLQEPPLPLPLFRTDSP